MHKAPLLIKRIASCSSSCTLDISTSLGSRLHVVDWPVANYLDSQCSFHYHYSIRFFVHLLSLLGIIVFKPGARPTQAGACLDVCLCVSAPEAINN